MKRFFLLVVFALALQTLAFAQCPDGSITAPGFHPPADQLPPIERGVAYNQTVQVNIPASFDTVVFGNTLTVTIDSIHINSMTGQPNGIIYSCTPSSCTFNGGTAGCIHFTGTTTDAAGQYPLTVNITAYVTIPVLGSQTQTLNMDQLGFSYYLTVIEPGAISVSASASPSTICTGDTATLTANVTNGSGSETYAWSSGDTTSTAQVTPTGATTYTVTVTDGGNVVTASTSVTVNSLPVAAFTSSATAMPTITFNNNSVGASSYSWDFGDGETGTDEDPTHTYDDNGTYTVELTATNGCGSDVTTDTVTITGVFIGTLENDIKFSVSPNPSEGQFIVNLTDNTGKPNTIKVFDQSGKLVFTEILSGSVERRLDLTSLPKGVYTLQLQSEKNSGVQKLVIR